MPRGIPSNRPTEAKHNPVLSTKVLESAEMALGHIEREGNHEASTASERVGETQLVQVADTIDAEWAANMKFMEEPVTIRLLQVSDKEASPFVELTINGRTEIFKRGEDKTIPRYYVDLLARLKITGFTSVEKTDDKGVKFMQQQPFTALKYDFAMIRDDNPMGAAWLKATLGMPG